MSQASVETPVAQSQHSFQPPAEGTAPPPPENRGYTTQEPWSNNAAPIRNRALSVRTTKTNSTPAKTRARGFSLLSLRQSVQPELSRKLFRLIKSENGLIHAYETAGRERMAIATQLSEWGEQTSDEAVNDISDKIGVILSEMGQLEEGYATALQTARNSLKIIRDTEKSVQPSRDGKNKITDELHKLKMKEPQSVKLVMLEQELVRAEAENLVAEAQLTNAVSDIYIYECACMVWLICVTDSSKVQGSVRDRVRRRHRARREANHPGQARPSSPRAPRRQLSGPGGCSRGL